MSEIKVGFGGEITGSDLEQCLEKTASELQLVKYRRVHEYLPAQGGQKLLANKFVDVYCSNDGQFSAEVTRYIYKKQWNLVTAQIENSDTVKKALVDNMYSGLSLMTDTNDNTKLMQGLEDTLNKFCLTLSKNIIDSGKLVKSQP